MSGAEPILSIRNLTTRFRTDRGELTAVDDVSFELLRGETLGIVGESGCGKTVTSKSIMRLLPPYISSFSPESRIEFDGRNLAFADEPVMRQVRGNRIAMIFQEPMTALNPVFKIGWQIDEALKYHTDLGRRQRRKRTLQMLRLVEIPNPERRIDEYPHQLSGGMRQRVMIAMALCCEPEILIADEPTTALDVTIQAQILRLMEELKQKTGASIILITHDLGVIAEVCDRVLVMYAGEIVEAAPVRDIFHRPRHPYTKALLDSIPRAGGRKQGARLPTIGGIVPSLFEMPPACRFQDRCPRRQVRCVEEKPLLETAPDGRQIRCFYPVDEELPDGNR